MHLKRREITIRAEHNKTREGRVIPMSARLKAVIEMARTDPTGKEFGAEAFVFGDVLGTRVFDIKRRGRPAC